MRFVLLVVLAFSLGGCVVTSERDQVVYSRADIDAINAAMQCRQLARNLLQASRCDVRR